MNTNQRHMQVFHFAVPTARRVVLVGDFTGWRQPGIPTEREPGGIWTASVALAPGTYRYCFIADGERRGARSVGRSRPIRSPGRKCFARLHKTARRRIGDASRAKVRASDRSETGCWPSAGR
jgi:1,4-alpha-glucan branching enzyme